MYWFPHSTITFFSYGPESLHCYALFWGKETKYSGMQKWFLMSNKALLKRQGVCYEYTGLEHTQTLHSAQSKQSAFTVLTWNESLFIQSQFISRVAFCDCVQTENSEYFYYESSCLMFCPLATHRFSNPTDRLWIRERPQNVTGELDVKYLNPICQKN